MRKYNPAHLDVSNKVNKDGVSNQRQFQTARPTCYGVRLSKSFGESWVARANSRKRTVTRTQLW